jgi:hypothetical protein
LDKKSAARLQNIEICCHAHKQPATTPAHGSLLTAANCDANSDNQPTSGAACAALHRNNHTCVLSSRCNAATVNLRVLHCSFRTRSHALNLSCKSQRRSDMGAAAGNSAIPSTGSIVCKHLVAKYHNAFSVNNCATPRLTTCMESGRHCDNRHPGTCASTVGDPPNAQNASLVSVVVRHAAAGPQSVYENIGNDLLRKSR